jgi:zinc protease
MSLTSNVQRRVLANGLTLLVERDSSAPVVAAVTHVKAGYFDEPDEWVGISHVLEHMFFKGTVRRPAGELARETQRLGGYLNAGTIYDKTVYYTVLPAADGALRQAVDLQGDALMHTRLDTDELSRELEVIIQEANRKLDTPSAVAGETLYGLLYGQHRIRRWRIGTEEGLRALTGDDLHRYYRSRYTPERTIVALVGDLDVDEAFDLASATYGDWRTDERYDGVSPSEEESPAAALRVIRGDVERPIAVIGWRSVDTLHPAATALDLAGAVLGSGRGSWLSRAVRAPGLASGVQAFHYTTPEVGVFEMVLDGDESRMDEAVARSLDLVAQLRETGPTESDIERVRAMMTVQWSRRVESMDGRASLWAGAEALGGYALADEFYRRMVETTGDEVREAAATYLTETEPAAVVYGGDAFHTRFEESPWPPTGGRPEPVRGVALPTPAARRPPRGSRTTTAVGEVCHTALDGADLLVRTKPGSGLVFVGAYALGLRADETPSTAGLSALLARSALRGAGGMDSEQLALAAERLGGPIGASASADAVGWGMAVRPDVLPEAARLVVTVASDPNLESQDVAVERSLQASDARRQRDDMFGYPIQQVLALALPESVYGLPALGTPETVAGLDDALVQRWAENLRSRRLTVVAVGDLTSDEAVEALGPFALWRGGRATRSEASIGPWKPDRGRETRDKAQSAIAMAFQSAPYRSDDRFPLIVAGSLLSGLAGTLFKELREVRSLAYTVAAMPWLKHDAGAVLTYIATSPDKEAEARDAMLEKLAATGAEDIAEADIERSRNHAAGALQLRLQSSQALAGEILEAWIHGDLESLPATAGRLRAVTSDDVRRVAADVFRGKERAEFVVEGRER